MNYPLYILSCGCGVQSSTAALMAELGQLEPMPYAAIFSDTQAEPESVYKWARWLKSQLSYDFHIVTKGNLAKDGLQVYTSKKSGLKYIKTLIPAFTLQPDGSKGLLGRKCTKDYKVAQIIKKIRELVTNAAISEWRKKHKLACKALSLWNKEIATIKKHNKGLSKSERIALPMRPQWAWDECQQDALAISWIGISTDEASRMKESQEIWIRNEWPLIDKGMSREDCKAWMKKHGFPEPPRSACTFCPFHSDDEWIRIRTESPTEFASIVKYEKDLQDAASRQEALTGVPFLHSSCQPIDKVKFEPTKPGYRQVSMFGNECEGLCGV